MRRLLDRMQVTLHLLGFHTLATFVGRWGSAGTYVGLRALDFDPTFNSNPGIEIEDLCFPLSKYDVN